MRQSGIISNLSALVWVAGDRNFKVAIAPIPGRGGFHPLATILLYLSNPPTVCSATDAIANKTSAIAAIWWRVGFGGQLSSTVVIDWLNPPLQWYGNLRNR